jgi:hypothetical protein
MKKRISCLAGALLAAAWGSMALATPPEADFDVVITALSATGTWQEDEQLHFVYRPATAAGWVPYREGRWCYTDYGWTWRGAEAGSWATDHYGHWVKKKGDAADGGWLWVPGIDWLPAAVEWLKSGDYLGWRASKLDRFSNPLEAETERYADPGEWNFVPAEKIRGPLTAKDFVAPERAKELLLGAYPVDHVFTSYRDIERPGPSPDILQGADGQAPAIPVVSDLSAADGRPGEPSPKAYYVYRPKFHQDGDGILRRVDLFLHPRTREQNEAELKKLTEPDPEQAKRQAEDARQQEELLERQRLHEQELYR